MARHVPLLFALLLICGQGSFAAFAQAIWTAQTTAPDHTTSPLPVDPRVQFFGIAQGRALDATGRFFTTSDGGATWVEKAGPSADDSLAKLNSLHFINPDTGWAITRTRETYRTHDGGNSWHNVDSIRVLSGSPRIFFADADTGWSVGDNIAIYRTVDGGATWTGRDVQLWRPSGIFHRDGVAWVLDGLRLLKSTGGENLWSESLTRSGLNALYFTSNTTGWLVGDTGVILKTTNGTTWQSQPSGTSRNLRSVHFVSADSGWIVGDSGTTLSTTNGGATWTSRSGGTSENLVKTWFVNGRTGWALGAAGVIYRTTDADVPAGVQTAAPNRHGLEITAGKLRYDLSRAGRVTVTVHALDGTRVALLFDGPQTAGAHVLDLTTSRLSPGLHLLSIENGQGRTVKTLILP